MLSGRAQKTHRRTPSSQEVLHDFWTGFGPSLAARRTRSTQSAKSKFTPSQPLTVGLPQS